MFEGQTNRTISEHKLNKRSSRSHGIFTIVLEMRSKVESSEKILISKINIIDLAGSERTKKTQTDGSVLLEVALTRPASLTRVWRTWSNWWWPLTGRTGTVCRIDRASWRTCWRTALGGTAWRCSLLISGRTRRTCRRQYRLWGSRVGCCWWVN